VVLVPGGVIHGGIWQVVRAKKKDTGNVYALKIMDKKFITKENKISYVKMERIVLDQLDHPGVIRLFFTFQDTYSLYMALESCEGGELFDQIVRVGVVLLTMPTMRIIYLVYLLLMHGVLLAERSPV
jgi:serine/threonine protein kinase